MSLRSKIMVAVLSAMTLSFFSGESFAKNEQPQVSSYLVQGKNTTRMNQIADKFEIVKTHKNAYEVLVPETKREAFLKLAPQAQVLIPDTSAVVRKIFQESQFAPLSTQAYHSFNDVTQMLNSVALANASIAHLVQYGLSAKGKPLLALRVSKHLRDDKHVPRVMLTAATHGDEIITTEILLNLMNQMLEKQNEARFAQLLDKMEIVFIPVLNPDGFSEQNRYDNGEDPNRSYPYPENVNGAPTASINGLMNFIKQYPIAGSLDFHAFGRMIMYPWGYMLAPIDAEREQIFASVTEKMAATNSYKHGQISRVIYIAKGSSADFYFWKYNSFSIAVEVGDSKAPRAASIEKYTQDQAESTWLFLENFKTTREAF